MLFTLLATGCIFAMDKKPAAAARVEKKDEKTPIAPADPKTAAKKKGACVSVFTKWCAKK